MNSTITCPHCHKEVSVDEVLKHQVEASVKLEYEQKSKSEIDEVRKKAKLWQEQKEKEFEEHQKQNQQKLEDRIKKQILEQNELDQKLLKEEVEENKARNKKLMDQLTENARELRKVREENENAQLEMEKKLSQERNRLIEDAEKKVKEEFQLSLAEKDKMLSDAIKANEDLKQKLTQGSQQMQGEILELELEQVLKAEFPVDEISPVGKGITGADIFQKVRDLNGRECGVIIWESKRTKHWDDKWTGKLKDDLRVSKSDLAILVTTAMPQGLTNFGFKDGIYITSYENFLAIAKIMRMKIIELCYAKMSGEGVNDKKEILWKYLTGNEFRQRVEAIVDAFRSMKDDLETEKRLYAKKWAKQDKLIDTVINQTIGIHGDLQGLMGAALPQIKDLEMDNFELVETTKIEISENTATLVTTTVAQSSVPD